MNYSKFSGLVACKMAMLLAFMFAACSDEPSVSPLTQDGGYTEEQGVYALVGRVGDVVPRVMDLKGHDSVPESNDGYLNAAKGTVVIIQELTRLRLIQRGVLLRIQLIMMKVGLNCWIRLWQARMC